MVYGLMVNEVRQIRFTGFSYRVLGIFERILGQKIVSILDLKVVHVVAVTELDVLTGHCAVEVLLAELGDGWSERNRALSLQVAVADGARGECFADVW